MYSAIAHLNFVYHKRNHKIQTTRETIKPSPSNTASIRMTQQIRQTDQSNGPQTQGVATNGAHNHNHSHNSNVNARKNPVYTPSLKWVQQIRALPSKPNDSLQLEFVIDNLDNSRKLIGHINDFTNNVEEFTDIVDERINGGLLQLNQVKFELDWLQ
ncbi:hypothetical protein DFJ63DRAFT_338418 [Scheffersomyces coipomensis]|uniref:uncharacterized protein n=1 Tax=Scheffersomyces coipomensis TaxID=1788519 RepID=UPI00315C7163